jgi:LPXTG-motif cell wall-anchored protein
VDRRVRSGALRQVKLAVVALVTVLVLSAPALAQSVSAGAGERSASSQQYSGEPGLSSTPALADGVREAADTAGRGADAANDALSGTRSSDSRVAGLTELPDTGGVPPFPLVAGILLVSVGLLFRKILR